MLCDDRLNDPLKRVISSECDPHVHFLYEFATMVKEIRGKQGFSVKFFTKNTRLAIQHTWKGLIDLRKYLLNNIYKYVMLWEFTTDCMEKVFRSLKQGLGEYIYCSTKYWKITHWKTMVTEKCHCVFKMKPASKNLVSR